jgi:hypothetical protein
MVADNTDRKQAALDARIAWAHICIKGKRVSDGSYNPSGEIIWSFRSLWEGQIEIVRDMGPLSSQSCINGVVWSSVRESIIQLQLNSPVTLKTNTREHLRCRSQLARKWWTTNKKGFFRNSGKVWPGFPKRETHVYSIVANIVRSSLGDDEDGWKRRCECLISHAWTCWLIDSISNQRSQFDFRCRIEVSRTLTISIWRLRMCCTLRTIQPNRKGKQVRWYYPDGKATTNSSLLVILLSHLELSSEAKKLKCSASYSTYTKRKRMRTKC